METKTAVTLLAALAQETRRASFRLLVVQGEAGLCAGKIGEALSIAPATLSFHLKELVHAQLVSAEREGRNLHYRPALARMNDLLAYLTDHCCMGQPCAPPGAKRRASC